MPDTEVAVPPTRPYLEISANAAHFDEETYQAARAKLLPYFRVGGGRTVTLSDVPPPVVVLTFLLTTLQSVPANVLTDLITGPLFDAIRLHFMKPKLASESIIVYEAVHKETRVTVRAAASDIEVVREAGLRFCDAVAQNLQPRRNDARHPRRSRKTHR